MPPKGRRDWSLPDSAKAIVRSFLAQFGLGGLAAWAFRRYVETGGGDGAMRIIEFELPQQQAFRDRFPSYDKLRAQGQAFTPAQIIGYERYAKEQLNLIGARHLYDNAEIQDWLVNGVSQNELAERISTARRAATAPGETTDALRRLYGLDDNALTRFWLDPDKAMPDLERTFAAGSIAGVAARSGFGDLGRGQAERLAEIGVDEAAAAQGFGTLGAQSELFAAQTVGEGAVSKAEQLGAVFEGDAGALSRIERRRRRRQAAFEEGSGFGVGRTASGAGVTGLG